MHKPAGIWPMLYAFFDADDRLDREAFRAQVGWCLARGCQGIATLGLLTEVSALSLDERRTIVEWAAEDIEGRVPLLATVAGSSVEEVIGLARDARAAGATFLVLQPPLGQKPAAADLLAFFSAVMEAVPGDIGIQNAPEFLGVGLEPPEVIELRRRHQHFTLMKGEGPVVAVKRFVDALPADVAVFNGRGGLELVDNLLAGCAGMIPAPETLDLQLAIHAAVAAGDVTRAERLYGALAPYAVFSMQSIPVCVGYGKRAFLRRTGIANGGASRIVTTPPDPFIEAASRRWLAQAEAALHGGST